MKNLLLISFLAIICISTSTAQIAGNAVVAQNNGSYYSNVNNSVDLSLNLQHSSFSRLLEANVMINVEATAFVAIFSLTQFAESIEEAEAAMKNRVGIFLNDLGKINIGSNQIFLDPVSMLPTYETELTEKKLSKTFNEVPTGFEMKKNVHIRFYKHPQINEIISVAAKAEVYDLVKVDYFVQDKDSIINLLRQEALLIIKLKKQAFESAGLHTRLSNLGEMSGMAFPMERYAQYTAYKSGTAPYQMVRSNKNKVQTVQYNYADKQKTVYYDKVSEKQFDKIINPVVTEPVIQIYFSMKAEFNIYNPEEEADQKLYQAKMKELQIKEKEIMLELKKKELMAPLIKTK